jgi:hypothetical protein
MLQASIFNVLSIFQTYVVSVVIWMLHMFSHICCNLQVFYLDVAYFSMVFKCFYVCLQVFHMHVSSVLSAFRRFKRCIWMFQKYIGVAHVATGSTIPSHHLQLLGRRRAGADGEGSSSGPTCERCPSSVGPAWACETGVLPRV